MKPPVAINLSDIEAAAERIEGIALRTPLLRNADLDKRLQTRVWIKPESLQHIGAFKFRGAYNRLCQLDQAQRSRGVVAFSSGNHAQGVAYAAQLLGIAATIVMPSDAPRIKLENTRSLGATVRLYDRQRESREDIAAEIATAQGAVIVPAFDDPDIIAGQGTCGLELMQQASELGPAPTTVISPVGGGGLMSGVATAVKALAPGCRLLGVEPEHYDDHRQSRQAGERVSLTAHEATLCDSLMAPSPGKLTWSVNRELVDGFMVVSEAEVMHAVSFAMRYLKLVVEPGGAVALAALLAGKIDPGTGPVAIILSGGNIDAETLTACLQRFPNP